MRNTRVKNITVAILLIIAVSLTFHFYRNLRTAEKSARIDLISAMPTEPQSLLSITKVTRSVKNNLENDLVPQLFSIDIPEKWIKILYLQDHIDKAQLSFHSGGCLLCIKTRLELIKEIKRQKLFEYPPVKENIGDYTLFYFPDINGRFMGCYEKGGLFIASYNKKLLMQTIDFRKDNNTPSHWNDSPLKRLINEQKVPYSWIFNAHMLGLPITQSDSWVPIEPAITQNEPYCTVALSLRELSDSLNLATRDSLNQWANKIFPRFQTSSHVDLDRSIIVFTIRKENTEKPTSHTD